MKKASMTVLGLIGCLHFAARGDGQPEDYIHDTFAGSKGAEIAGRSPDKSEVPGVKWAVISFNVGGGFRAVLDVDPVVSVPLVNFSCAGNSNGAMALALGGSSTKPQRFTITVDLRGASPSLGFYSALPVPDADGSADVFQHFTGLQLQGNGALALYRQGGLVTTINYTGTFDPKAWHKLSYEVDTVSGTIRHVSLQGSTSDYVGFSEPGIFTAEATAFAAIGALCEGGRDNQAYAKDFIITALPSSGKLPLETGAEKPMESNSSILIKTGDRIGFMGDSITQQGDAPKGYVRMIIAGLKAEGIEATAIPAGHSGDTSGNMVGRVNPQVLHLGATWMTLSCGVNDVLWESKGGGGIEAFKKNVATMVAKAQGWGLKVVLLTPTPFGEDPASKGNQSMAHYVEFMRQFAAEKKLPVADMNAAFWKVLNSPPDAAGFAPGKRLLADGIHPNERGQFLMATTLLEALGVPATDMPKVEQAMRDSYQGK